MIKPFFKQKILLASQSPRRQFLLKESGFDIEPIKIDVEESFDENLKAQEIPIFLAKKKAEAYSIAIPDNHLLVTADTVVWLNDKVLNKPLDLLEAKSMLIELSNNCHSVYTAVNVKSNQKETCFFDETKVYFNTLSEDAIDHYLNQYSPLDKAGSYGIQEFIGFIGIKKIEGCYYNVMGFPVSKFIEEINKL